MGKATRMATKAMALRVALNGLIDAKSHESSGASKAKKQLLNSWTKRQSNVGGALHCPNGKQVLRAKCHAAGIAKTLHYSKGV